MEYVKRHPKARTPGSGQTDRNRANEICWVSHRGADIERGVHSLAPSDKEDPQPNLLGISSDTVLLGI